MLFRIERKRVDDKAIYGLIVAESNYLILLQEEYDFQFDGYRVIRRRDVSKMVASDSCAYCERLMRKEGLWKNPPKTMRSLPLKD